MTPDHAINPSSHVMSRQVGDEVVLLDLQSGTYYGLDAVGARVWQLIANNTSLSQILEVLLREYEVEPDTLRRDIEELIAQLKSRGIVVGG